MTQQEPADLAGQSADTDRSGEQGCPSVRLRPVDRGNWRDCADLEITDEQAAFVAPVSRYLALCAYDQGPWHPVAISNRTQIIGFAMHATDPDDHSFWIGGLVIGRSHQRHGYGRAAVRALIDRARHDGHPSAALSYQSTNVAARRLYTSLGFTETGETEDAEIVARLPLT